MHIPKVICEPCNLEMRPVKNGVVVEMMADTCIYYYKISGDRYQCTNCKQLVVTGFAKIPLAEPFQDNYEDYTADVRAEFRG